LRGSFRGLGPAFLALRAADTQTAAAVSLSTVSNLLAADDSELAPWTEVQAGFEDAPRLVGVGLQLGSNLLVVGREQIFSANGADRNNDSQGLALGIVLLAVGLVVLTLVCVNETSKQLNTCSNSGYSLGLESRFIGASLAHGPGAWPPGETRRP